MTTPVGQARVAAYFAEREGAPTRRDERLARTFEESAEHERLATMRDDDPTRFDALPRSVRMGLGHYLEARAAARRVAGDAG